MANMIRLSIDHDLHDFLRKTALEQGVDTGEIIRRGLSVIKAFRRERRYGRRHLGFVADPHRLDVEIVGILN